MSKSDVINKAVLAGPDPARKLAAIAARPFVAKVAAAGAKGLFDENQRLKAERSEGKVILELDPKAIRFSTIADRDSRSLDLTDPDFADLLSDIRSVGQREPIWVKELTGDERYQFEVVSGHRRHRVCEILDRETPGGWKVHARIMKTANDRRVHAIEMWRENTKRKNLSPWEEGLRFKTWLDEGLWESQQQIADVTGQTKANVSKFLAITELPSHVIGAFADPRKISLRWVPDLTRMVKEFPEHMQKESKRLAALSPPLPADEVFAKLMRRPKTGSPNGLPTKSESIKQGNKVLFTFSNKDDRFAIKLGKHVHPKLRKSLHAELKEFLHNWLLERAVEDRHE